MSSETHEGVHRHPAPTGFIRKYIFSVDHKIIGIQYIMLALAAVVVGMAMSLLMRLSLSWPGTSWPILETLFPTGAPGGIMTPEFYLSLVPCTERSWCFSCSRRRHREASATIFCRFKSAPKTWRFRCST